MNEAINWEDKMDFNAMKRRQFLKTSAAAGGTFVGGRLDVKSGVGSIP
jgi:hypothetical protein